jgi:hypothetical protein
MGDGFKLKWEKAQKTDVLAWLECCFPHMNCVFNKDGYLFNADIRQTMLDYSIVEKNVKIKYSKDFIPLYFIGRKITHDGTLIFLQEEIRSILTDLLEGCSYCDRIEFKPKANIKYTVGDLLIHTEYHNKMPGKNFPGQTDTFALPILVEFDE